MSYFCLIGDIVSTTKVNYVSAEELTPHIRDAKNTHPGTCLLAHSDSFFVPRNDYNHRWLHVAELLTTKNVNKFLH